MLNIASTNNTNASLIPLLPTDNEKHTPPELSTSDIIVIFIYMAILVFGFSGNLLVVHFFGFKNKVERLYHIYLIHLAVADLISATVTSGYFIFTVVSGHVWYLGEFSCKLISVIGPVTVNVSAWLLVSIAHERYRGIISPFKPRLTKLRIHLTVAAIWFVSFLILIPYALSIQLVDGWCRMQWSSPAYELTYAVGTLVVQSLVPIIYMTYTVNRILHVLRNRMVRCGLHVYNSKHSNFSRETSFMTSPIPTTSEGTNSSSLLKKNQNSEEDNESNERDFLMDHDLSKAKETDKQYSQGLCRLAASHSSGSAPNLSREISPNKSSGKTTLSQNALHNKRNISALNKKIDLKRMRSSMQSRRTENNICVQSPKQHVSTSEDMLRNALELSVKFKSESEIKPNNTQTSTAATGGLSQRFSRIFTFDSHDSKSIPHSSNTSMSLNHQRGGSIYQRLHRMFLPGDHNNNNKKKLNSARQRQRIAMLVVTFSVFVVCSLPYNLFYVAAIVIYDLVKDHSQFELLQNINLWVSTLVVSNSIMNCFIYAGMDNGFKLYCKRLVTCYCITNNTPSLKHQNRSLMKTRRTYRRRR